MSEDIIERLNAQIKEIRAAWAFETTALRKENARLREAVKNAYYEGWQDNASIDDTEDRLHAEWEFSEAHAAILGKVKAEAACPAPDEAP